MSRVGKKIINIPDQVEVNITNELIKVKGPKGELKHQKSKIMNLRLF